MMSDIGKVFLQILFSDENDERKFNILWYDDNRKLIAHRYCIIVFGFSSSPFILNQVIILDLQNFPYDSCSEIIGKNMDMDNLLVSGNDLSGLIFFFNNPKFACLQAASIFDYGLRTVTNLITVLKMKKFWGTIITLNLIKLVLPILIPQLLQPT